MPQSSDRSCLLWYPVLLHDSALEHPDFYAILPKENGLTYSGAIEQMQYTIVTTASAEVTLLDHHQPS